jgi:hypothetical protein
MGVDEKPIGERHRCQTLIYDLDAATVEDIEDNRPKERLDGYFYLMSPLEGASIEAVATDHLGSLSGLDRERVPESEKKPGLGES